MTFIVKASGETVPFNNKKLRRSLKRVGADRGLIEEIVKKIESSIRDGMSTRAIYRMAFKMVRKKSKTVAAKFHLKQAMFKLGRSGFPFEKYVAELLHYQGMSVVTNKIIKGKCVRHEVDVIAKDKDKTIFVECKYHNLQGVKSDLKVSLYVKSRFDDLRAGNVPKLSPAQGPGWLVTNTGFTRDAIDYGTCAGVHLVAWNFPKRGGNLREIIENSGLYPITCLTDLTQAEIAELLADGRVLCRMVMEHPTILDPLRIPKKRRKNILAQCEELCTKMKSK